MGLDYTVFVGPFLRCKFHKVTKEKAYRGCSECSYESTDVKTKFCPSCGKGIVAKTKTVLKNSVRDYTDTGVQEDTFVELYGSMSSNPQLEHWLRTNLISGPGRSFDPTETHGLVFLINEINPQKEIEAFEKQYAEEIVALRKAYDSVVTEWGCVSTIS